MKSLKECASNMYKAQMFMAEVSKSIKDKTERKVSLTDVDEQNIDKLLLAYEDILKEVDYFESATEQLFIEGVNDARFILNVNIRQSAAEIVSALNSDDMYEDVLNSYFFRLQALESEYGTDEAYDHFHKVLTENAGKLRKKRKKFSNEAELEGIKEIKEFMELLDSVKIKINTDELKKQLISIDSKSAHSLMKAMDTVKGDYVHALGYLFIYVVRQLESGGKLYQGLPTESNRGLFLNLAGKHLYILNFSLKNVLVLLKELDSLQKTFGKTTIYAILDMQFGGFLGVVGSYVDALEGSVTDKDADYQAYVKEYTEMKRLYSELTKYQGKRKIPASDMMLKVVSETVDFTGDLTNTRDDIKHYDLDCIPSVAQLGASLKRALTIYRHSKQRDEFTFSFLLSILFIYDSYIQNLSSRFLTQVATGESDIEKPREGWHHNKIEYYARLRGVALPDFEIMSDDMESTYADINNQLAGIDSLA